MGSPILQVSKKIRTATSGTSGVTCTPDSDARCRPDVAHRSRRRSSGIGKMILASLEKLEILAARLVRGEIVQVRLRLVRAQRA
jgi:hypothetical protein